MSKPKWEYSDGGREAAGYKGDTGDCVTRAIAIAAQMEYQEVYDALNEAAKTERPRNGRSRSGARTGISKATSRKFMADLGWQWTPTMGIGTGCTVHVRADELPAGRLVLALSKHYAAFVDGVVHDTHDCSRDGTRCVYGYYRGT